MQRGLPHLGPLPIEAAPLETPLETVSSLGARSGGSVAQLINAREPTFQP